MTGYMIQSGNVGAHFVQIDTIDGDSMTSWYFATKFPTRESARRCLARLRVRSPKWAAARKLRIVRVRLTVERSS